MDEQARGPGRDAQSRLPTTGSIGSETEAPASKGHARTSSDDMAVADTAPQNTASSSEWTGDAPGGLLSDTTCEAILAEAQKYPKRRTALLPSLKLAQADLGHLPAAAAAEVADLVGVSHAASWELATFYSMLHLEPKGRFIVDVCVQLPCALRGGERLLRDLVEGLGVAPGQTTADGVVTLVRTPECLGGCHRAPMAKVNEEYRENLTPEATQQLIAELKQARPAAQGDAA
jgi:NADH-quinone oxidoreductase subunit E